MQLVRQVLTAHETAPEGATGRRRDPQRARGGLPRGDQCTARRSPSRRGPLERLEGAAGGRLHAGRGLGGARADPAEHGRGGAARRRPWHARRTTGPRRARSSAAARAGPGRRAAGGAGDRRGAGLSAAAVRQRSRRLHRGGPRVRRPPRRGAGDAAALDQRARQSALRKHRHLLRRGAHLGGEQPREPADPVRQRPGHRPDRRGDLPPRRGEWRAVGRDAGPVAAHPALPALGGAPRRRRDAVRARRARHRAGARRLRGARRAGEALAADADQPLRADAAPRAVLVLRVAARAPQAGGPRYIATELDAEQPVRSRRATSTARSAGASPSPPRASRCSRRPGTAWSSSAATARSPAPRARPAAAVEPLRRRSRPLRRAADDRGPAARRDATRAALTLGQGRDAAEAGSLLRRFAEPGTARRPPRPSSSRSRRSGR